MQLKPRKPDAAPDLSTTNGRPGKTGQTSITQRHEIPVAAGQTVVVTPRLSPLYKTVIWFSFILNLMLLLVLLTAGSMVFQSYRAYRAAANQIDTRLNTGSVAGQTAKGLLTQTQQGPGGAAQAVDQAASLAQQKAGVLNGAVESLQNATIKTTIPIDQQVPVALQVAVNQDTTAVLTQPLRVTAPATISFPGGGGTLNTAITLNLPAGLNLPIHLKMTIPVTDQKIQVKFDQPVSIPLKDTELAGPFAQLHDLIKPLVDLFKPAK